LLTALACSDDFIIFSISFKFLLFRLLGSVYYTYDVYEKIKKLQKNQTRISVCKCSIRIVNESFKGSDDLKNTTSKLKAVLEMISARLNTGWKTTRHWRAGAAINAAPACPLGSDAGAA